MEVAYDPSVIQQFAERLYKEASSIIVNSTLLWALIGAGLVPALVVVLEYKDYGVVSAGIGAVVGAVIGYNRGREKAFRLRLEAQTALCQVQIERNLNEQPGGS